LSSTCSQPHHGGAGVDQLVLLVGELSQRVLANLDLVHQLLHVAHTHGDNVVGGLVRGGESQGRSGQVPCTHKANTLFFKQQTRSRIHRSGHIQSYTAHTRRLLFKQQQQTRSSLTQTPRTREGDSDLARKEPRLDVPVWIVLLLHGGLEEHHLLHAGE
jgi:hypothetical protein